jgi:hypothetical protein
MNGGELMRGLGLNISELRIKKLENVEYFGNLPLYPEDYIIDAERTSIIDFSSKPIGRGRQGIVRKVLGREDIVIKLLKIKEPGIRDDLIEDVVPSYYASNINVGPKIYGSPFITVDEKYVAFIMEKVNPYYPNEDDVPEIIDLLQQSIDKHFVSVDHEFAKTLDTQRIILLDLGICSIFNNRTEALIGAIREDAFADVGGGRFYSPKIEEYFTKEYNEIRKGGKRGKEGKEGKYKKTRSKRKKRKKKSLRGR